MTDPDEPVVEKWTTLQVAEHLGISRKTVSSYRARGQMPAEDGRTGPHGPWWWSTTITGWTRPGQGVGGGPKPKR